MSHRYLYFLQRLRSGGPIPLLLRKKFPLTAISPDVRWILFLINYSINAGIQSNKSGAINNSSLVHDEMGKIVFNGKLEDTRSLHKPENTRIERFLIQKCLQISTTHGNWGPMSEIQNFTFTYMLLFSVSLKWLWLYFFMYMQQTQQTHFSLISPQKQFFFSPVNWWKLLMHLFKISCQHRNDRPFTYLKAMGTLFPKLSTKLTKSFSFFVLGKPATKCVLNTTKQIVRRTGGIKEIYVSCLLQSNSMLWHLCSTFEHNSLSSAL